MLFPSSLMHFRVSTFGTNGTRDCHYFTAAFLLAQISLLLFLLSLKQDCSIVQHYTVKTLAHLPSCISVTKECYQIGFLN